jgi:MinD superfamily P-loop ATPase
MKEITIISGKGGTGKTSISAAFATLEYNLVVADCDVDAANLYLILQPENEIEEVYISGHRAVIDYSLCTHCGLCANYCRFDAITSTNGKIEIVDTSCDGCKLCSRICPAGAIVMVPNDKSRWYAGVYRNGQMVHARLAPGEENSGKLVNVVREYARKVAAETKAETIIIDGPPGTGCPVISALSGVKIALLVTEPSKSGFHDLKRIFELTENFNIKSMVVINKYDLNIDMARKIEEWCSIFSIPVLGKIPFDRQMIDAMLQCRSIVEYSPESLVSQEIKSIWTLLKIAIE